MLKTSLIIAFFLAFFTLALAAPEDYVQKEDMDCKGVGITNIWNQGVNASNCTILCDNEKNCDGFVWRPQQNGKCKLFQNTTLGSKMEGRSCFIKSNSVAKNQSSNYTKNDSDSSVSKNDSDSSVSKNETNDSKNETNYNKNETVTNNYSNQTDNQNNTNNSSNESATKNQTNDNSNTKNNTNKTSSDNKTKNNTKNSNSSSCDNQQNKFDNDKCAVYSKKGYCNGFYKIWMKWNCANDCCIVKHQKNKKADEQCTGLKDQNKWCKYYSKIIGCVRHKQWMDSNCQLTCCKKNHMDSQK